MARLRARLWVILAVSLCVVVANVAHSAGSSVAAPLPGTTVAPVCSPQSVVTYQSGQQLVSSGSGGRMCVGATGEHATEQQLTIGTRGDISIGMTSTDIVGGVLTSTDQGRSWRKSIPPADGPIPQNAIMGYVVKDKDTDRLFASSLGTSTCANFAGHKLAYSDDNGATWSPHTSVFCEGFDWGKTFIGKPATQSSRTTLAKNSYPNIVYFCSGATFESERFCYKSLNGGATFARTGRSAFTTWADPANPRKGPTVCTDRDDFQTIAGNGTVGPDGTVYVILNACGRLQMSKSSDEGDNWTIVDIPVAKYRGWNTHEGVPGFIDPPNAGMPLRNNMFFNNAYGSLGQSQVIGNQLVADKDGNLYVTWIDARDNNLHLSVSRDGGGSWSPSQLIAPPGVIQSAVPAIQVDVPGHVAVAFWGTTDKDPATARFDGYIVESHDALNPAPTFRAGRIDSRDPTMPNGLGQPIESAGIDFAPDGTPWAAFTRDKCRTNPNGINFPFQCDGFFLYLFNSRYDGLVAHLIP